MNDMQNDVQEIDDLPEWIKIVNGILNENVRKKSDPKIDELSIEYLVFKRINELSNPLFPSQIIRFPAIFSKICPIYCLTKDQAWKILKRLEDNALLEIVPFQGVRISDKHETRKIDKGHGSRQ